MDPKTNEEIVEVFKACYTKEFNVLYDVIAKDETGLSTVPLVDIGSSKRIESLEKVFKNATEDTKKMLEEFIIKFFFNLTHTVDLEEYLDAFKKSIDLCHNKMLPLHSQGEELADLYEFNIDKVKENALVIFTIILVVNKIEIGKFIIKERARSNA